MRHPLKIGLTGGIGSGKTTISERFKKLQVPIIDADILAYELVAPGTVGLQRIIQAFSPDILQSDGSLDRQSLAQQVFSDQKQRQTLEGILHPLVYTEIDAAYQQLSIQIPYCIIVVPLLIETKAMEQFEHIIVVDSSEVLQLQRAAARTGMSEIQIQRILQQQATRAERLQYADDVIKNDSDLASLHIQVQALHDLYLQITD